jgi:hypothetical protein
MDDFIAFIVSKASDNQSFRFIFFRWWGGRFSGSKSPKAKEKGFCVHFKKKWKYSSQFELSWFLLQGMNMAISRTIELHQYSNPHLRRPRLFYRDPPNFLKFFATSAKEITRLLQGDLLIWEGLLLREDI